MDLLLVGIIVSAAIFFTIRSFIKIYKGEGGCSCGGCKEGCSSALKDNCSQDFPIANNK